MKRVKHLFSDKRRVLIIALAVAVFISMIASAMTVSGFTDYSPPGTLVIDWYDYFGASNMNSMSPNNAATDWPRWSAEYPYRALFLGRNNNNNNKVYQYILIYSKQPATSLFTFEYLGDTKASDQYGYIRAKINQTVYTTSDEIVIKYHQFSTGENYVTHPSFWGTYTTVGHTTGNSVYFDFDFYYDCTNKHQQSTQLLSVSGLRNISVPYAYILTCDGHGSGGGSTSGGSSGGGSSGSGGSSSSKNTSGDGDRHGWGDGDYGGGVNKDKINSGSDGGGYSSRPDMELSVPDDWKKPVEDNFNEQWEYKPDYSGYEYDIFEGDTGQTGADGELPSFKLDGGVSGSYNGYKELKPNGEYGLIDFMEPMEEWLK